MSFRSEQLRTVPSALPLDNSPALPSWTESAAQVIPGVAVMGAIAAIAFGLRQLPLIGALSPMILAILMAISYRNVFGAPARAKPGIKFCLRRILRLGVAMLGLQLTVAQIAEVGGRGVAIILATLVATFLFTTWAGKALKVERKLAQLIAGGTSICGASAIIATNAVTRASDEDVSYAIACVTVFGSVAMCLYPLLPAILNLDAHAFGLWAGASIHEIAQVVAAAFQDGQEAGKFGTIAKLSRVLMLAPMILALGVVAARKARPAPSADRAQDGQPAFPWFVGGFLVLVVINSLAEIPNRAQIAGTTTFLLTAALAAMGMETDLGKLRAKGLRPAALAALSFIFIAGFSLILIKLCL